MNIKVVVKTGTNPDEVTKILKLAHEVEETVELVILDKFTDPVEEAKQSKKLVDEKATEQTIIFANPVDFPILLAETVKEASWERGYWAGASPEHKQYLKRKDIHVFVVINGVLYRLH